MLLLEKKTTFYIIYESNYAALRSTVDTSEEKVKKKKLILYQ